MAGGAGMSRGGRERDLAHDADPVRFANAVLRCEGYTPDCAYHGRCQLAGQCFASPGHLVAARLVEGLIPSPCPSGTHFAYLARVAELLRSGLIAL